MIRVSEDDYLAHYGVKGMKWRHRKHKNISEGGNYQIYKINSVPGGKNEAQLVAGQKQYQREMGEGKGTEGKKQARLGPGRSDKPSLGKKAVQKALNSIGDIRVSSISKSEAKKKKNQKSSKKFDTKDAKLGYRIKRSNGTPISNFIKK